jgi:hypothetical protein
MDARWTPPAAGPLMTRATARESAALLRRSPSRPGRARRERTPPAQQVHHHHARITIMHESHQSIVFQADDATLIIKLI